MSTYTLILYDLISVEGAVREQSRDSLPVQEEYESIRQQNAQSNRGGKFDGTFLVS